MKIDKLFYGAEVISVSDKKLDGEVAVYVPELLPNYTKKTAPLIYAKSIGYFSSSGFDKTKIYNGVYEVPEVGANIVVFFLNSNVNDCYYMMATLHEVDDVCSAMNVPTNIKLDVVDIERKPKLYIKEFSNRNVLYIDNNSDIQELGFVFDNGCSFKFASPNNYDKFVSSDDKSSILELNLERKDGINYSTLRDELTKESATFAMSLGKRASKVVNADYPQLNTNNPYSNSVELIAASTKDGVSNRTMTSFTEDLTNTSNTINSVSNDKNSVKMSSAINYMREATDVINYLDSSEAGVGGITNTCRSDYYYTKDKSKLSRINYSETLRDNQLITRRETLVDIKTNKASRLKEEEFTSSNVSVKDKFKVSKESSEVFSELINRDTMTNKELESLSIHRVKNDTTYTDSLVEELITISDNKPKYKVTVESKNNSSSILMSGDSKKKESKLIITNKSIDPNPADITGSLGLDPFLGRGHEIEMVATKNKSSTTIRSVKDSFMDATAVAGPINSIIFEESGTEAKVEINLMGINQAGGVKLVLSTNGAGGIDISIPSGNVNLVSNTGSVNVTTTSGEVNIKCLKANIESSTDVNITSAVNTTINSLITNITSSGNTNIKSSGVTNIESGGVTKITSPVTNIESGLITLGKGASMPTLYGPATLLWMTLHTHTCTSPGNLTSPPMVIPPTSLLNTKVLS